MLSTHRLSASASAFAFLILPTLAHAEEESSRNDIVVTAKLVTDDARREVEKRPGGVDVVDASNFENKVTVSLRDALAFSPGVYTQPRFGQEVRLSVRGSGISRGFHMRGLTLMQDGIPINLADDNGDFQELDPQVFQRIEVYRGGNALRFGGSTLGGAINAVTPTGRTAPRFELRIDGGSFNTIRAKAAAAFATEHGDAYLALTTDNSDGDRDHAGRGAIRFNGNVGLRLTETVETRFYATVSHIDQDLPGSLTLAQALNTPKLSLPANITGNQERDIDSIRLQNRTTVDLGSGQLAFGAFFNAKNLFHPIFQVIDQNSNDYGVFASVDLAGGADSLPWELTLGTQARFGTIAAKQFVNVAGNRGAPTARTHNSAHTINSYGELRVTPIATLTFVAGGIYTSGEREIDNLLVPVRSGKASFNSFAPKAGLLYEPIDGVQLYANYNRSVELPGYSELSQTPATGLPGFTAVNPQKAWTFEIGTRGQLGIASWDITFYRADLKGEMLQYAVSPNFPASTFNAGRTRHQGIEAGLDLVLTPWVRLRQVFQLNDFRFRGDAQYGDNRLPVVPKHQYRAEVRLGTDTISVSPNIEWLSDGAWADYRNTVRAPGYTLFGIGAEARVRDGITLFVDARNITGKKAIGDVSAVLLATPATVAFYPVERRAFYGGLRASF
ncbi:ligand-gated channel protein [Sphingomonas sp. Root710]|uniref:TonB-dependent receptor family protein n=1 Tax=Sphingomonas sp. Root710 TaxID=1736594 RepID=UPI0006F28C7A|nr:TonB-dependent receptor [Sphingomonas sp. Root710]KRB85590.1 ligand-gated channel protein [Sphingomonas sp. Root710]